MLKNIFPDKQLLIRQNGDVKYISLPNWLQVVLVICVLLVCATAIISSYQSIRLEKITAEQAVKIEKLHIEFDALHLSYQEKHSKLSDRISRFDEKSQIMSDMLSSLPEAQQQEFSDKILETDNVKPSNDPSTSPAKSDQEQSDTNNTPDEQSDISTRNPALDPITVEVVGYNSVQHQHSDNQLQLLSTQLDNRFTVLNTIIDKQTVSLLKAIESSGMDKSYIANISNQSLAQGGPLYALETDVLSNEQKTLLDKITTLNTLMGNVEQLPKTLPAKHFYISSVYGLRNDPISKRRAMHRGIDMAGWHKTKIFSPASGIVTRAGKNGGFGNFIEITHINGFVTRYGHLAKINVKRGQQVQKDDVIGLMGSSGRSTSTHLHYEILHNKRHINPLKFIKAFDNVSE